MSEETPTALAAGMPAGDVAPQGEHPAGDESAASPSIINEGGGFTPGWYSDNDRLRDHSGLLDRYAGPADLAQGLVEMNKLRPGAPGEGATPETVAAFKKWVGAPDKYELTPPEGKEYNQDLIGKFGEVINKHNGVVTNAAMGELVETFDGITAEAQRQQEIAKDQQVRDDFANLAKQYPNDWESKREAAIHLMQTVGIDAAGDPRFGNNAAAVELAAKLSGMISEGRIAGGNNAAGAALQSAGQEADRMMMDENHPDYGILLDPGHPRFKEVNARYLGLVAKRNATIR